MKISFVIPAYNEVSYIEKCLNSIFLEMKGRSYDVEIIVVNNASTDNTKEVANSFSNVVVIDEPQKGLVPARRAGYLKATGDLIANIDADTMLTQGWLDKVMSSFSKNPELVAISGPHVYYDLPTYINFWVKIFYYFGYVSYYFSRYIFRNGSMLQGGNFVIKKTAFEKIGGYNPDFVFYGEDTDVAQRLNKVGQVEFTFKLPIYASGRRLRSEGVLLSGAKYVVNYFWTIMFKKPFHKKFTDVRY
jgi:cellulose synthase/poly-beta-1,6-N-acetylglucosamine synthase-like glycosyltransferase